MSLQHPESTMDLTAASQSQASQKESSGSNQLVVIKQEPPEDGYPGPGLIAIFPMPYRHFRVNIYKQLGEPSRYFYEPIVLLDPKSVQSHLNKSTNQAYVRFKIRMWDSELEEQVIHWLKRLPGCQDVQDFCVQAMPYEEIRLVRTGDNVTAAAYRLPKQPTPYHQLAQHLHFQLFCETKETADDVAESFRADPEISLQNLALECTTARVSVASEPQRKRPRMDGVFRCATYFRFNIDTPESARPAQGTKKTSL